MPADVLDPVAGDPLEVATAGRVFDSIAADIASTAAKLRSLASGATTWTGTAATSARARSATLPPKLDKVNVSYATAGNALGTFARALADAQHRSAAAIATAARASADLQAARAAQAAAVSRDAQGAAAAAAAGQPAPPQTAPRYQTSIDDAAARLRRAETANSQAHDDAKHAARNTATSLKLASHEGIHNQTWWQHVTHTIAHWASTHWAAALRDLSKLANVISALAGIAALALSIAGVFFPPLEAPAAVLEAISLVGAVVAGVANTTLAATGKGSWTNVGIDALTLLPAGLAKVVTKAAPAIRETRLLKPRGLNGTTRPMPVVHAIDTGGAARLGDTIAPLGRTYENSATYLNDVANHYGIRLRGVTPAWDASLSVGVKGLTKAAEGGWVIRINHGFSDEADLANTLAHELRHARDFQKGLQSFESPAYSSGDALEEWINGLR